MEGHKRANDYTILINIKYQKDVYNKICFLANDGITSFLQIREISCREGVK